MTAYRAAIAAVRAEYAGRMEVLAGIEWDSWSDVTPEGFDYWIGSVHYQRSPEGVYYSMDWKEEQLAACRDAMYGGDALAMAEGYFRAVGRVAEKKPTILGHIDLITKLNAGNRFFDEESPRYRAAALEALHHADPERTLLEINTGGVAGGIARRPIRLSFCCGSGGPWGAASSSPPTPTAKSICASAMTRRRAGPGGGVYGGRRSDRPTGQESCPLA